MTHWVVNVTDDNREVNFYGSFLWVSLVSLFSALHYKHLESLKFLIPLKGYERVDKISIEFVVIQIITR